MFYCVIKIIDYKQQEENTMRKLYYNVEIKIWNNDGYPENSQNLKLKNKGFLVVEIDNGKILSMEGLLTRDYMYADVEDDGIMLHYYEFGVELYDIEQFGLDELFTYDLNLDEELPLHLDLETETMLIKFFTERKIENNNLQQEYERRLDNYKHSSIYTGEW